jgi:hypothetical protein
MRSCEEEGEMKGDYPCFKATYVHEELVEHFLLSPADRAVVELCHGETNRHSVAVLLKTVQYLGYFPEDLQHVPLAVRTFIAHQLHLLWDHTADYPWQSSTRDRHLALIRQHTGWRFPTAQDKQALEAWLQTHAAPHAPTEADLKECAYSHLRTLGIELPAERELQRMVRTALYGFFHALYHQITTRLTDPVRTVLDALLVVGTDETHSVFDQLKADPAAPGIKPLQHEIAKLHTLRALHVPPEALTAVSDPVLHLLTRPAANERAGEMRAPPAPIRYALLACFIHQRTMEVIDPVVRMMLESIRRIDTQTDKHLQKELCRDIKRVTGKVQLLFRVAEAVVDEPEGTIRDVLFPRVKEETFRDLAAEAKASGAQYRIWYHYVMRQKYGHHYRQMLPLILEHLTFRSENRFQPVIEALAVMKQSLGKGAVLPEEERVPSMMSWAQLA